MLSGTMIAAVPAAGEAVDWLAAGLLKMASQAPPA
jgi:hypothetical protein